MKIGETIKKLRKQKDMTQEQLAEYLSISAQAVSRWEMNSTLPDITLVPMLANIFDVTTDMLLGVDIESKEKRIETAKNEAFNLLARDKDDEAIKLLRGALKEFPNSHTLMDSLATILSVSIGTFDNNWTEEEKSKIDAEHKPIRDEIIALCEKNLAACTDDSIRYSAIQTLCNTYTLMGEAEKAKTYAKKMPHQTQGELMTEILKGTAKFKHLQNRIMRSLFHMINAMVTLTWTPLDDGTDPYNADETIALFHKMIDIIHLFIEEGPYGDFNYRLADHHGALASRYAGKNDAAAALHHFKLAAKHAAQYDAMPNVSGDSKEKYTCLLFKGQRYSFNIIHKLPSMSAHLLETSKDLDSALPASELEEIKNELRKQAERNCYSGSKATAQAV